MTTTVEEKIDKIFNLYNDYGSVEYMGQSVTHLEHALQTAYFARRCAWMKRGRLPPRAQTITAPSSVSGVAPGPG